MEDKTTSTIQLSESAGISVGDEISLPVRENRWWVRAWYFLTFRKPPWRCEYMVVADVSADGTTLTIDVSGEE